LSKFQKGPLLRLANQICREHGRATGQKIPVAVFLATGEWKARPKAWLWLIDELNRRKNSANPMERPARVKKGGKAKPIKIRCERPARLPENFTSTPEWRKLRFEVLKESNGQCCLCGRSAREHGVVLHVDHIKPKSLWPDLALAKSNLQVLCEDCNMGKGNRDDTDWRAATPIDRELDAIDWRSF